VPLPIPPDHYRLITAHIPSVSEDEIETNSAGHDHMVYFVQRRLTFRFPRVPRLISPTRKRFLDAFARCSPIPLPLITIEHDAGIGGDYEVNTYLSGVPFESDVARAMSRAQLQSIGGQFGAFLSALHAFPLAKARALGMDELDPATFGAYMEENPSAYPYFRRTVFPHLTPPEQEWVARLFGEYIASVKARPFPICVTHSDMWLYHILVDPRTATLTGVLDYWPRIADPARDLKAFESYGPDFVSAVYQRYTLPRDETFDQRRLFYSGHDAVAELARALAEGDPERIAARHASLTAYIAAHPHEGSAS
jgi:aminoglycoside 2''-phosphotransferase